MDTLKKSGFFRKNLFLIVLSNSFDTLLVSFCIKSTRDKCTCNHTDKKNIMGVVITIKRWSTAIDS